MLKWLAGASFLCSDNVHFLEDTWLQEEKQQQTMEGIRNDWQVVSASRNQDKLI